jgi:hypothetical protein
VLTFCLYSKNRKYGRLASPAVRIKQDPVQKNVSPVFTDRYPKNRSSSVNIVFDYGQGDRAVEVRCLAEARGFFSSNLCVQTGFGAHQASCPMGTVGPLPGGKAQPGRDADHSSPSSAVVVNGKELCILSRPALHGCVVGLLYLFTHRGYCRFEGLPVAHSSAAYLNTKYLTTYKATCVLI